MNSINSKIAQGRQYSDSIGKIKEDKQHGYDSQLSLESLFLATISSISEDSHFHSSTCPLECILKVMCKQQQTESNEDSLLVFCKGLQLWKVLYFLNQGIKCQQCSCVYTRYLTLRYESLIQLIIWFNCNLFSLQDYVAFFCLNDLLITAQNSLKAIQRIQTDYIPYLMPKQSQLSINFYYFKLVLALLRIKHQQNQSLRASQQFIDNYIKQAGNKQIELMVKLISHTHFKCQQIRSALKDKTQKGFIAKQRNKLLSMLNSPLQFKQCLCFDHHHQPNHQKLVTLNLKRTDSKIVPISQSAHHQQKGPSKDERNLKQKEQNKSGSEVGEGCRILEISNNKQERAMLLSELQKKSLSDAKSVKLLYDNYLTMLQMNEFIQRVNKTYTLSSQQSKQQWGKIKQFNKKQLGLICKHLFF